MKSKPTDFSLWIFENNNKSSENMYFKIISRGYEFSSLMW